VDQVISRWHISCVFESSSAASLIKSLIVLVRVSRMKTNALNICYDLFICKNQLCMTFKTCIILCRGHEHAVFHIVHACLMRNKSLFAIYCKFISFSVFQIVLKIERIFGL